MIVLLALNLLAILVIVIRFVHPRIIYWLRDIVVASRVKRDVLTAKDGRERLGRGRFASSLDRSLRYQVSGSTPEAMRWRCTRIRQLFGMMSERENGAARDRGPRPDLAGTIMELADMVHGLGSRIPADYDTATPVVGAESFLAQSISCVQGNAPLNSEATEDWLAANPMSVEQIGELLIAAVYALAFRQDVLGSAARGERGRRRGAPPLSSRHRPAPGPARPAK